MALNQALIDELAAARAVPITALGLAVLAPEEIADEVLRLVTLAADGADLAPREENLLFWGLHVLGVARIERACGPLLHLLRRPDDTLKRVFGDAVTATLPNIVLGVFDGDATALQAVLTDPATEDILRYDLFGTLAFLTAIGRIERDDTRRFLERFDDERLAEPGALAWAGWETAIALLGLRELSPRLDAARRDGRTPTEISTRQEILELLRRAEDEADTLDRFADEGLGYIDDIVKAFDWLEPLSADALDDEDPDAPVDPDAALPAELGWQEPVRNPLREIGRNDPCPCGSGAKYKRCCLGR
jgi:uncharacterized protein